VHNPVVIGAAWVIAAVVLALAIGRRLHEQHCQLCPRSGVPTVERRLDVGQGHSERVRVCLPCAHRIDELAALQRASAPGPEWRRPA
jgi:hypothetical protein